MTMFIFIINPTAGNGRAKRTFKKVTKSKLYNSIISEVFFTKYPGHAEEIVASLLTHNKKIKSLIVIGGDGTLHEVVNGLKDKRIPLSFIPGGSGNDFARGCLINDRPIEILEQIIHGHRQIPYWIGEYKIGNSRRSFVNSIGFGFDAQIAKEANESRYKRILNIFYLGLFTYLFALIRVLFTFKPMDIEIEVNNEKRTIKNCWMITISNHPYYGGGMKIIPDAKIQPTIFPLLIIHSIPKWKVFAFFITVFSGKHLLFKEVELIYTSKVKVSSKDGLFYHADGEVDMCKSCVITKQQQSIQILGSHHSDHNKVNIGHTSDL